VCVFPWDIFQVLSGVSSWGVLLFFYFLFLLFYSATLCCFVFFPSLLFAVGGLLFFFFFSFFLFYFMRDGATKYVATSLRGTGENLQIRSTVKNEIKDIAALRFEKGGV